MNNRLVAMLVVALVIAGCGKGKQADSVADAEAAAKAPAAAGADVVAAVLQSPGTPIAKLGFVIATRPVVGTQSGLRLDFSAPEPAAMLVVAEGDGLAIDPATARANVTLVTAGTTVSHQLRFTPQREGLTEITVRLNSGEADSPVTTYAIPVLVAKAAAGG